MSKIHKRRNHTAAFKKEVVLATFKGGKSIQQIAAEHEIHPDPVSKWKAQGLKLLDDGYKWNGVIYPPLTHTSRKTTDYQTGGNTFLWLRSDFESVGIALASGHFYLQRHFTVLI